MLDIRTDLALERHAINAEQGVEDGIVLTEERIFDVVVTKAEVLDDEGERLSHCKAGVYYSADVGKLWLKSRDDRRNAAEAVKALLLRLLPKNKDALVLVVGLGNRQVTPDAIGPKACDSLVVTHHMKTLNRPLYDALGLGDLAAICPSVLGQTGFESAITVKSAVNELRPLAVIAIDALAARSVDRLGTTIQISNVGIAPGSGVDNRREELSATTLGCPVISVGVPTVVDARTVAIDLCGGCDKKELESFFVAPKESDVMIRVMAKTIALAINAAIHGDAEEYAPL